MAVSHTAANVHDSKVLEEVIDAIGPIRKPRRWASAQAFQEAACRQGIRLPSMSRGFEEEHNPPQSSARHRIQRDAGAIQVGCATNFVVGEPQPAIEGPLRATPRHPSGVSRSRMCSDLLALRSAVILGVLRPIQTSSGSDLLMAYTMCSSSSPLSGRKGGE